MDRPFAAHDLLVDRQAERSRGERFDGLSWVPT